MSRELPLLPPFSGESGGSLEFGVRWNRAATAVIVESIFVTQDHPLTTTLGSATIVCPSP